MVVRAGVVRLAAPQVALIARWLIAFLLLPACVAPLDRRVPRASFAASREALKNEAQKLAPAESAPLFVGWSRVKLEPPKDAPLAGYASRGGVPHEGEHDPTYAKAIAVAHQGQPPIVLLALDLLLLDRETSEAISSEVADVVPRERLIFTASHTHGGMGGYAQGLVWEMVLGDYLPESRAALISAADRSIRRAVASLQPGKIGFGEVLAPGLNLNRVRKKGVPVDPVAAVLWLERSSDRRSAVWVAFAAHATTVSDLELGLTADYPGVMQAALEKRGFDLAAFSAGAVGSMAPRAGWSEHPGAIWTGQNLASAVADAIPAIASRARDRAPIAALRFPVTLPRKQWRIAEDAAVLNWVVGGLVDRVVHVQSVSFGRDAIVSLPVELSGEIAARIRQRARERGELVAITTFGGEYAGYVVPRSAYDLPEGERGEMAVYESRMMSFYGPWMGDLFAAASWRAARVVLDKTIAADPAATRGAFYSAKRAENPPPEPPRPED